MKKLEAFKNVYVITNLKTKQQYIGVTGKRDIKERFKQHCNVARNTLIHQAISEYREENFKIELLCSAPPETADILETFFILFYHTHRSEGGYNISYGGKNNPMNDDLAKTRHWIACHTDEFIQNKKKECTGRKHSEATKEKCRQNTLANLDVCCAGFRKYNESRKIPITMLDKNGTVLKKFDCASDAARFLTGNNRNAGNIIAKTDKFLANGERAKCFGYYFTRTKTEN